MSYGQASESDELVTKQFLRAELAGFRSDLASFEKRVTVRLGAAIGMQTAFLAILIVVQ